MLGGMSGGGMGFIFSPHRKPESRKHSLAELMTTTRRELQHALPFAMDPVVYDFAINERGTFAQLLRDSEALLPAGYYALMVPHWLQWNPQHMSRLRRAEMDTFAAACRTRPELSGMVQTLFDRLFPKAHSSSVGTRPLHDLLQECGFDHDQHESIRTDLRNGRIGLAQNRLPATEHDRVTGDVQPDDIIDTTKQANDAALIKLGRDAIANGEVAVVSLAAGAGSRWTQGAGVVKALHPFAKLGGAHRSFLEVHLAKSRKIGKNVGTMPVHVVTTSYLTHDPIEQYLARNNQYGYEGPLLLSPGRAIGLRLIPMERDLRFAWEEMPQKLLDEQQQKVRHSLHAALIGWARMMGEGGTDYTDNVPQQCLHPVGHWYRNSNLLPQRHA